MGIIKFQYSFSEITNFLKTWSMIKIIYMCVYLCLLCVSIFHCMCANEVIKK